jgi:HMG (high mobility group) box
MSQATNYASDVVPCDVPVRFESLIILPLLQPPPTFKRVHHQPSLARYSDAKTARRSHRPTSDQTCPMYPTVTASTSQQHPTAEAPLINSDPRSSILPNPAPIDDAQQALGPPAKKSHARRQPEGHIPRPRNAFILFRSDFVAQKKIPASVEPDHRNISRIVGRIWKAMSDEARQPWIEEAKRERERHKRLYPQYRYAPSSATSSVAGTALKEKRAQNQKIRESMGVLPPWEVASQTSISLLSSPQPIQGFQQREVPQTNMHSQPRVAASDDSWSISTVQDSEGSVASHALPEDPSFIYSNSWEPPCQFQPQHWSFPGTAEPQHCSPNADTVTLECFKVSYVA